MTIKHNYLNVASTKPTALEAEAHEIIINEADGTLWTKNSAGIVVKLADSGTPPDLSSYETIVKSEADDATTLASAKTYTDTEIGAIPPTDLSAYSTTAEQAVIDGAQDTEIGTKADTTYVDSENAAQDTIINGKASLVHTHVASDITDLQPLLDAKEDNIPYGASGYIAVANASSDGFTWVQPSDSEFYRLRGTFIAHAGSIPDAFADTVGDNVIATLVAGIAPAGVGEPSGICYRSDATLTVVIHPLDPAVNITPGDLVFWSGDSSKWLHLVQDVSDGVESVNNKTGAVVITGTDGITLTTGADIAVAVDATVSRDGHTHVKADITDFTHTHVEDDITDLDKYTKAEVDSKDATTLSSANTYTDSAILAIPPVDLSLYETIVASDANDASTLVSAQEYTDSAIGAIPPTDISGKADITYVDSENAAQDSALQLELQYGILFTGEPV